jgi:hypothetical protein
MFFSEAQREARDVFVEGFVGLLVVFALLGRGAVEREAHTAAT